MGTRKNMVLVLGFIIVNMVFIGCPIEECVSPLPTHTISGKYNFEPSSQIVLIRDTLWMKCNLDCSQIKNESNGAIDNICGNINTINFALHMIKLEQEDVGAVSFFNYIQKIGTINTDEKASPEKVKQVMFERKNDVYQIIIGFIPQNKGRYCFYFGGRGVYLKNTKKCEGGALDISLGNIDRHISILEQFKAPTSVTQLEFENSYCFEVQ